MSTHVSAQIDTIIVATNWIKTCPYVLILQYSQHTIWQNKNSGCCAFLQDLLNSVNAICLYCHRYIQKKPEDLNLPGSMETISGHVRKVSMEGMRSGQSSPSVSSPKHHTPPPYPPPAYQEQTSVPDVEYIHANKHKWQTRHPPTLPHTLIPGMWRIHTLTN